MAENLENKKSEAALREERILEFWKENKTFEKSLNKKSPKGHYVFYDGPPFATGQMHYGHILGSTVKDVIGRYKTMEGYHVPRKWGWDCHGLPIENIVEKELGIAGHVEIEKYGIDKFVEYARSKVLQYDKDWEKGIERIGRWVDFKGQYKTMDNTFIESVWWALSEFNKKNLIYEGVRVLAYCARCETPIANSEIAMDNSYKDIADISVYVKFKLEDEPGTYLLAWTTTPWTLPGNTAIAVNKDIKYIKLRCTKKLPIVTQPLGINTPQGSLMIKENFILAKDLFQNLKSKIEENYVIHDIEKSLSEAFLGSELVGKKYKPVFDYYKNVEMPNKENIWKVWHADFVTTEKGTGIAHEAPAFGEDDMNLAKEHNIPWIIHVDEAGRFKDEVVDFKGLKVKPKDTAEDKDAHLRSDIEVIKYLQKTGSYFEKEKIIHSYPHCMRCDTPIIYYALPSWFISIQKVKENILKQAESMSWTPEHLKEGRFKNIIESAPDWNISRNRYWASPLPIWKCEKCKNKTFISSLQDLKEKTKKSGNKYFMMRHGESENNVLNLYSDKLGVYPLTEKGREETEKTAKEIAGKKITKILCSPLLRTRETADIVAEKIDFPKEKIIYENRLREFGFGDFSDQHVKKYDSYISENKWDYDTKNPNGESFQDAKNRVGELLYELEQKYQNENILMISHGFSIEVAPAVLKGANKKESIELFKKLAGNRTASLYEEDFIPIPHNEDYELDLHRPYIDDVKLECSCSANLTRISEVLDCWFESGSMPFAQDHYPFENKEWQKNNFPAGFVAEYIGQVRTWFYYTHVVSTILFDKAPFKHIVSTGTVRAEDGEKMSKSKNNYPDPWIFINKYGVDALRIYLMSSTLMKGEDANFSEKAVQDISNKIIGRLFNVLAFYQLYRDEKLELNNTYKSKNILDEWIISRLYQMLGEITKGMDEYDIAEATRPIDLFVDDLSTWYLRRSRDRIKEGDKEAKATLYFVLKNLSKIMAPFAPLSAEDIWLKLKNESDKESVHLESWPKNLTPSPLSLIRRGVGERSDVIRNMEIVRKIVTLGLEARQKASIKVRQPLSKLRIKNYVLGIEYTELIKDELNVKEITQDKSLETEVDLDIKITEDLKQEGDYRELVRALQDMRKKMGLTPSDVVSIVFETGEAGKKLIEKFEADLKKTVLVSEIKFNANAGDEIKIDNLVFKVKIDK